MILVTGAAGFVGSRYVEALLAGGRSDNSILSVDRESHFHSRPEHSVLRYGKIIDRDELFNWLSAAQPTLEAIVHLGACTDTTEYNEDYLKKINLEYSQKLWNYATERRVPFIYASSAATYGDGSLGFSDDEALIPDLKPLNPYGESKRLFDLWVLEQERLNLTPPHWSGFKFFNVYGWGEKHKNKMASLVMPAFEQIRATGQVKLFKSHRSDIADGQQMRDFIAVEDIISVLNFARTHPIARGIYNLGTGKARSFRDLVCAVFSSLGVPEKIEYVAMPDELQGRYQYFTEAKMDRLIAQGYQKPFLTLEAGVKWYLDRLRA